MDGMVIIGQRSSVLIKKQSLVSTHTEATQKKQRAPASATFSKEVSSEAISRTLKVSSYFDLGRYWWKATQTTPSKKQQENKVKTLLRPPQRTQPLARLDQSERQDQFMWWSWRRWCPCRVLEHPWSDTYTRLFAFWEHFGIGSGINLGLFWITINFHVTKP